MEGCGVGNCVNAEEGPIRISSGTPLHAQPIRAMLEGGLA